MIPTISQVCSMHSDFARDIEEYAAAGCGSVELWFTKLEAFLGEHSLEEAIALMGEHSVACPVASLQGGLFQEPGEALGECQGHFERRLSLCSQLGIETVVVALDILPPLTQAVLDRLPEQAAWVGGRAEAHKVAIAFEFQPESAFLNNLQSLCHFLREIDHPALGICLDVLNFERSCSKESDLALLTRENLRHVQLSDMEGEFRELEANSQRILPGDGSLCFDQLRERLDQIGYSRALTVELLNPIIWGIPPRQFADVALSALGRFVT